MSTRNCPALHLPQSPLIFVLAQVKMSPVLTMEQKIPALQESFRKNGFPRLSHREIEITRRDPEGKTRVETRKQWEFINIENNASILVDTDFLAYQVTQYKVFEDYMESFEKILEIFNEQVEPSLMQRIGLRYVDLVTPSKGKSLDQYFSQNIRGIQIEGTEHREGFMSESVSKTGEHSTFVHRYAEAKQGFGFPPDLMPLTLKVDRELRLKNPFGLLDMDHFIILDNSLSINLITEHLWSLHNYQTKAFEASVTKEALEEWRQE